MGKESLGTEVQLCSGLVRDLELRGGGYVVMGYVGMGHTSRLHYRHIRQVIKATSFSCKAQDENKRLKDRPTILVLSIGVHLWGERKNTDQSLCFSLPISSLGTDRKLQRRGRAHLTHPRAGKVAENRSEGTQRDYSSQLHGSRTVHQKSLETLAF